MEGQHNTRTWGVERRQVHSDRVRGKKNPRPRRALKLPPNHNQLTVSQLLLAIEQRTLAAYQLAPILGVEELTLYRMARKGQIPSHRINSMVKFDTVEVARWWDNNRVGVE